MNISNIHGVKVRNLLRGIIGKKESPEINKAINKLRKMTQPQEFNQIIDLLAQSQLFKDNSHYRNFNNICPKGLSVINEFSPGHILKRINEESDKILELMMILDDACNLIEGEKYKEAVNVCGLMVSRGGVSCVLLRLLFFIRINSDQDYEILRGIDSIFKKIKIENTRQLPNIIKELGSPRTDYFKVTKKIMGLSSGDSITLIAKSFIEHCPKSEEQFVQTLSAYHAFSLLDSYLYWSSVERVGMSFINNPLKLNDLLIHSFRGMAKKIFFSGKNKSSDSGFAGINFYRQAFLFVESDALFKYKTIHGAIYNYHESKIADRLPYERELINNYFGDVKSLSNIASGDNLTFEINLDVYRPDCANYMENSGALLRYIEANDGNIGGADREFVKLMSFTTDIGLVCPLEHLKSIKESASYHVLKLVAACLVTMKDKSSIEEHDLRCLIQEISEEHYGKNIKKLLEDVYNVSRSVAEHFVNVCDEVFLSRLFHLTGIPNDAIEARAEILDWYGKQIGDSSYVERAKNLKIDIQISKQKGTIDESRIYVDPVKFTQWVNDNVTNELAILFESISGSEESEELGVVALNWDRSSGNLSEYDQIGLLLAKCYEEFCVNKYFGVASYIGRRVRHGTLKGTGMKGVKDFKFSGEYSDLGKNNHFMEHYNVWLRNYEKAFDELTHDRIHIRSKIKTKGMINPEISGSAVKKKIANIMLQNIRNSYIRNKNCLEAPYIITEYCWMLIEDDLAVIKRFMMNTKSDCAVFNVSDELLVNLKGLRKFCAEINTLTADKFRTISSWFTKPSIASPSTDLVILFKAVKSEIQGLISDYSPKVLTGNEEFTVNGGTYFAIYDALYILIFNAATYGKKEGVLEFKLNHDDFEKHKKISISIISEMADCSVINDVIGLISQALNSDHQDAHVIENRSGIKKLKRMEFDAYISNVRYEFNDREIIASFDFGVNV
jgi:hypothetical protein